MPHKRKIFVSYKHDDERVASFRFRDERITTARGYLNVLEDYFARDALVINKSENDNESLSHLPEDAIRRKLYDKLYDTSMTIVLISRGMKEPGKREKDQWIPQEVAYSLKEMTRGDRTSHTNAILAVLLPDRESNPYHYCLDPRVKSNQNYGILKEDALFKILSENMRNLKNSNSIYMNLEGPHSYIPVVKWWCFLRNRRRFMYLAFRRQQYKHCYNLTKELRDEWRS